MKHLYRCALYLLLIVFGVALILVIVLGVEALIEFLLRISGADIQQEAVVGIVSRIPTWIPVALLVLCIGLVALALYKQECILHNLRVFINYWITAFNNLWIDISVAELAGVLIIPFIASIYFGHTVPISYDEAITYVYFTVKPFFYCMIFYPYPNNHVLHSLLTNITEYIPFLDILFRIRIPAVLSSIMTWLIAYSFLKKYYSARIGLVVVGLASVFYMSLYYGFMSRGYAFMVLAFVVCMYATFNIIKNGSQGKDWMFFTVAGILGCYTIPSFLYPFATLNLIILIYNYKNIKQQFIYNSIAGIATILLYIPIMVVDGVGALTSNQFVEHIGRIEIAEGIRFFYNGALNDIIGIPSWITIVFLTIAILLCIKNKDKWHLSLSLIFILAPFVLIFLHAVHPFYRTFLYYNFIILFIIVVPFKGYIEKIPKWIIVLSIIPLQLWGVCNFKQKVGIAETFNTDIHNVVETIFEDGKTYCFPCVVSVNYEFEIISRGMESQAEFRKQFESANVDTISGYDYIILPDWRDKTVNKKPYIKSEGGQHVYKGR